MGGKRVKIRPRERKGEGNSKFRKTISKIAKICVLKYFLGTKVSIRNMQAKIDVFDTIGRQ